MYGVLDLLEVGGWVVIGPAFCGHIRDDGKVLIQARGAAIERLIADEGRDQRIGSVL